MNVDKLSRNMAVLVIVFITALCFSSIALASDITNAKYMAKVTINNATTALTNAVATFTLSTSNLISSGMLNATATDCAMLNGTSGSDIYFMPAWSTNPWCTFVSSIGASTTQNQYLYTKDVTGGTIRYFPGSAGGTVPDTMTEPGNNCEYEFTNVRPSTGAILTKHDSTIGGIVVSGNTTTSKITANIHGSYSYAEQLSINQDRNLGAAYNSRAGERFNALAINGYTVQYYFIKSGSPTGTLTVRMRKVSDDSIIGTFGTLDVSTITAGYVNFSTPVYNSAVQDVRISAEYSSGDAANYVRIESQSGGSTYAGGVWSAYAGAWADTATEDAAFKLTGGLIASASVTLASYGDEIASLKISLTGGTLTVNADGTTGTAAFAGSIPDNTRVTAFGGDGVIYVDTMKYSQGGALVDTWEWEYAVRFTGTVTGNYMTPSFRTSSTSGITASITSITGTYEGSTPAVGDTGGWTMISSVPGEPSGLFTDGGSGFPMGPQISQAATDAGDDPESWIILFALGLAILAFIILFTTTHNTKLGRTGSLILASIGAEIVLVYFYRVGSIPGLLLIPAGIMLIFFVFWRKSPAPVD